MAIRVDYFPPKLEEALIRAGESADSYSEKKGHNRNWLRRLYSTPSALGPYIRFANTLQESVDTVVTAIENKKMRELWEAKKADGVVRSIRSAAIASKVTEGFISNLIEDNGKLNAIQTYIELARDLSLKVDDVCPAMDFN